MAAPNFVIPIVLLVFSVANTTRALLSQNFAPPRSITARHSSVWYAARERWDDERDDEVSYRTRYTGDSAQARELQNMSYEQDETVDIVKDDYYYEDDDEEYLEEDVYLAPRTRDEEDDEATGNFWFNPKQGFDPLSSARQRTSRVEEKTASHPERRPRPRPRGAPKSKYVVQTVVLLCVVQIYSTVLTSSPAFCRTSLFTLELPFGRVSQGHLNQLPTFTTDSFGTDSIQTKVLHLEIKHCLGE